MSDARYADHNDDPPSRPRRRRLRNDDDAFYDDNDGGVSMLIPYRNGMALGAYYCGVFALVPCLGAILGPLALAFGIVGLKRANERPRIHGKGHAIAGIVLGSLTGLANWALIVFMAVGMLAAAKGR